MTCMNLLILVILHALNHRICGLCCLASFTDHNIFEIPLYYGIYQYFVIFYGLIIFHCTYTSPSIHLLLDIGVISEAFWLVITSAVSIHMQVFICVKIYFLMVRKSRRIIWWLYHLVRKCQNLFRRGHAISCSHKQHTSCPIFLHPHQHMLVGPFECCHPRGCAELSHCGFDLHCPND